MSSSSLPLTILATSRFLVGFSALVSPITVAPIYGIALNRQAGFMGRLFGSRDTMLALATLYDVGSLGSGRFVAAGLSASRLAIQLGMAIDIIDVITGLVEWSSGNLSDRGCLLGSGGAALLVGLAVAALQ